MRNSTPAFPVGFADPDGAAGPVTIRQGVAWGELDALGHVNHTVYLRWFENARFAWFERVGIAALMRERGGAVGPILARVSCDYRIPVGFPDAILTSVRCVELGRSSLTLRNSVWSEQHQAVVAEGEVVGVMFDYAAKRSTPISEAVRAAIHTLDGAAMHA
ncbi:acyl-CoA thioesterase [Enhygromyxa salina]|uniref:1,4-dihydroxy-2-naphthoyl-CoA hydrolase n=1 Tax=Enhygromyxa salina TaxID=215803 RepID=A0A2S9YPZ2_9BACT|nr:thioesterase family protein [Enhygromyxa salina]PRQ07142.1 1,4-dihydroxy-2-naphthoyl-CoA hydrolase [Enhygromyxa salina]